MSITDTARLGFFTRNFNPLQFGLWVMIPLGFGNLVGGLARRAGLTGPSPFGLLGLPLLIIIPLSLLGAWYTSRHRGTVRPARSTRKTVEIIAAVVIFIGIARIIPLGLQNRVNFEAMSAALMLILAGALPSFPWRHYTWVGCGLLAAAFLPWTGAVSMAWMYRGWDTVLIGLAYLLCGLLDEMRLARLMQPVAE